MVCCAYAGGTFIYIGDDNVFPVMKELVPAIKTKRRRRPQKQTAATKTLSAPKVVEVEVDELAIVFSQYGGDLFRLLDDDRNDWGRRYRMRCNASHERRKTRFLTERRRQVVRY